MDNKLKIQNAFDNGRYELIDSKSRGALYGLCIGDALAMPVHWYYNRQSLLEDYGRVTDYVTPRNPHPDSELYLKVVFKGKGGVSTGRLLAAVNRPH